MRQKFTIKLSGRERADQLVKSVKILEQELVEQKLEHGKSDSRRNFRRILKSLSRHNQLLKETWPGKRKGGCRSGFRHNKKDNSFLQKRELWSPDQNDFSNNDSESESLFLSEVRRINHRKITNETVFSINPGNYHIVPLKPVPNFSDMVELKSCLINVLSSNGITQPTLLQTWALPLCHNRNNVVISAPHNAGKKLLSLITCLNQINPKVKKCQAIIYSGTRLAASQAFREIQLLGKEMDISCHLCDDDDDTELKNNPCTEKPQIIVGTPERLSRLTRFMRRHKRNFFGHVNVVILSPGAILLSSRIHLMSKQIGRIIGDLPINTQIIIYTRSLTRSIGDVLRRGGFLVVEMDRSAGSCGACAFRETCNPLPLFHQFLGRAEANKKFHQNRMKTNSKNVDLKLLQHLYFMWMQPKTTRCNQPKRKGNVVIKVSDAEALTNHCLRIIKNENQTRAFIFSDQKEVMERIVATFGMENYFVYTLFDHKVEGTMDLLSPIIQELFSDHLIRDDGVSGVLVSKSLLTANYFREVQGIVPLVINTFVVVDHELYYRFCQLSYQHVVTFVSSAKQKEQISMLDKLQKSFEIVFNNFSSRRKKPIKKKELQEWDYYYKKKVIQSFQHFYCEWGTSNNQDILVKKCLHIFETSGFSHAVVFSDDNEISKEIINLFKSHKYPVFTAGLFKWKNVRETAWWRKMMENFFSRAHHFGIFIMPSKMLKDDRIFYFMRQFAPLVINTEKEPNQDVFLRQCAVSQNVVVTLIRSKESDAYIKLIESEKLYGIKVNRLTYSVEEAFGNSVVLLYRLPL